MDALTHKEITAYKLTLKALTYEQLYDAWAHEHAAKHFEHTALIIAEMDVRKASGVIEL
jgi:cytolysin (calcineurin-like family phosphatase)